jgi:hypothetical protein
MDLRGFVLLLSGFKSMLLLLLLLLLLVIYPSHVFVLCGGCSSSSSTSSVNFDGVAFVAFGVLVPVFENTRANVDLDVDVDAIYDRFVGSLWIAVVVGFGFGVMVVGLQFGFKMRMLLVRFEGLSLDCLGLLAVPVPLGHRERVVGATRAGLERVVVVVVVVLELCWRFRG